MAPEAGPTSSTGTVRHDAALVTVSSSAITHNTRHFVSRTAAEVMAVVKADGYGHGASLVARAALAGGATWLGVTSLAEALELRVAGFTAPILSWLNPASVPFDTAARARIDLAVSSLDQLRRYGTGTRVSMPVRLHLHVDTGLARDGAAPAHWAQICAEAARLEADGRVRVIGVMSHMAHADEPAHPGNAATRARFAAAVAVAYRAGLRPVHRHLAATSAAASDPAARDTMVRIGAGLVGIDLSGVSTESLIPAMTFTAPVLMVRTVPAGTSVGYGATWCAPTATTLATVQAGYADGVPRVVGGRAEVQIRGRRCPIVGRVSMDQIVVDASGSGASPGDTATLWGPGRDAEPTIAEWAQWAETIPHEMVTGIGQRVHRTTLSAAAEGHR